ncbi:MAG TPA: nucleotide sugar dehydrogenase [Patescibacteria group bacterium]
MTNIGVIGHGFVGKAVEYGFSPKNKVFVYDKYQETLPVNEVVENSEFIFICVPTPMSADYAKIDLSIIYEATGEVVRIAKEKNLNPIIVLKSTIVPGTTEKLREKYEYDNILFNPEFLTEANYLDDFVNTDRIVIGGHNEEAMEKLAKLYKDSLPPTAIFLTNPTAAEMVKYMANTYLASKVMFANEMAEMCEKLNIDYGKVKEMVVADKRIYDSHLDVTDNKGFGGKCFPKDTVALLGRAKEIGADMTVLNTVWKKNLKIRKVHDWEEIPGAVSAK